MDSTVDSGPAGFLGIFGGDTPAETAAPEPDQHDAAQVSPTAAEPETTPEEPAAADLSAADLVAARFAASLEADGIEVPDPESTETTPDDAEPTHPLLTAPDTAPSLDNLTPEQLRALAEEAIRLRGEVSTSSRQEAGRKVAAAEAAAVAQVQAAYEQQVLAVSAAHYSAIYQQRLAALVGEVSEQELPARAAALAEQVYTARQQWETEQADAYEEAARQAALTARRNAPEFRQYAATELVRQAGLPAAAVAEVLKTTNTAEFPERVEELLAIRDALLAERARNQVQLRAEGNRRLRETTPRTAATGRLPGGKPPDYTGSPAEGAGIISLLRQSG